MKLSESDWKKRLSPDQYRILRNKGTDPRFMPFNIPDHTETLACIGCGNLLFSVADKYESGSGWPSFTKTYNENSVTEVMDYSHDMVRVEVVCAACGGHLGHVFEDGPKPLGKRYCINGSVLTG